MAFTPSPEFGKLYNQYFPKDPKNTPTSLMGGYRSFFDRTTFSTHRPLKEWAKNDRMLYDAIRGNPNDLHKFVHSDYRTMDGEFGEDWDWECLLLLLYLGDDRFANMLAQEDQKTQRYIGSAIGFQVDPRNKLFPQTSRIVYSSIH
jgi:hypothetical protein